MIDRTEAEEHLRVIRSLMEKATVYRAISAPGALVSGSCAVAMATAGLLGAPIGFLPGWLGVLAITGVANLFLLWRDAQRRGEVFVSAGMRVALRAMLPGLIGGGLVSFVPSPAGEALIATLWVLFSGISFLAASHFAPRAICWLGRVQFGAAALLLAHGTFISHWWAGMNHVALAHGIMGATFGLFHLGYAACTWPRRGEP